jgi:hypothetical protein
MIKIREMRDSGKARFGIFPPEKLRGRRNPAAAAALGLAGSQE